MPTPRAVYAASMPRPCRWRWSWIERPRTIHRSPKKSPLRQAPRGRCSPQKPQCHQSPALCRGRPPATLVDAIGSCARAHGPRDRFRGPPCHDNRGEGNSITHSKGQCESLVRAGGWTGGQVGQGIQLNCPALGTASSTCRLDAVRTKSLAGITATGALTSRRRKGAKLATVEPAPTRRRADLSVGNWTHTPPAEVGAR